MVMTYEQWNIILGVIDQEVNLSEDNVIERIKELLKEVKILGQAETSRMLEEISHGLEVSSKIPRVQETQEPLKKRLKVVNVPQTKEEAKKILKESRVSNAQQMVKRMLKRLGVQETSEKSKAVALEDVLNARKISEKVPAMLETQKILKTLSRLKEESRSVYEEWKKAKFDVNHWFTVNCFNECFLYTLLYLVIDFKLDNLINAMLEVEGIDINAKGPFSQWTPLHLAVEDRNTKVVRKLIEKGANVNQLDSSQRTTLYQPAVNGDIEITKILVKNNVDVNAEDLARLTALYKAAANGHKEVAKYLMQNGADVKKNGALKLTPYRASVDIEDKLIGRSPLHIAAVNGNVEAVELLINYKANVNHKDAWGWTPFNCAAARGNIEIMNCLIANGANIETNDSQKILFSIHPYNSLKAVNTMIQLEIYKDVIKLMEAEFLRYAAKHGNIQLVCTLLALGVNVNASNDVRLTALHQAAKYNHPEVVKILILYGANVNSQNDLGESPLTYAVERRNWIVVITLLYYGANPSLPDNCYETVRDLAERQGISNLLMEAEKRTKAILTQLSKALDLMREQAPLILKDVDTRMMKDAALDMSGKIELSINLEHMIRDQANQIEQLQYNAKLNEKRVISLAGRIECMQLGSNTKACPAEMDGVKEQKVHSPHRWVYSNKQAHYTKNVNREEVRHLARDIKCMKLQPNTHLSRIKELSLISSSIMEKYSAIIESPLGFNSLSSNDRCRGN